METSNEKYKNIKSGRLVLALNKSWLPVDIISYKDAFRLMCKGHALALDTNMESDTGAYMTHDMASWMDLHMSEHYEQINTVSMEILVPEIIILTEYEKIPKRYIRFSKLNLLIRDNFKCAYCLTDLNLDNATIDHVIPQALGGETSFSNCVIACRSCNHEKACELPVGKFKPKVKPKEPHHSNPIYHMKNKIKASSYDEIPDSWKRALFHA